MVKLRGVGVRNGKKPWENNRKIAVEWDFMGFTWIYPLVNLKNDGNSQFSNAETHSEDGVSSLAMLYHTHRIINESSSLEKSSNQWGSIMVYLLISGNEQINPFPCLKPPNFTFMS